LSALKKDINSTEKLLNVIRGKDEESFGLLGTPKLSSSVKDQTNKFKVMWPKNFFDKKSYTVGIDVGLEFICFIKTTKGSDNRPILVDKKIIKYSPEISNDSSEFKSFLKSSIIAFCGSIANCNIWIKISTSEVNVHFVKIPRVPKNKLENVIYWTAKKESFVDEEKSIFDFELQGEIVEQGNPKYSVMVYTAPKAEIERIKSLFSEMEIPLAGITTVPFAIQNIFRSKWMPVSEEVFASLFIGSNYSRIDVYNKDSLVMTRIIKTGSGNSMTEAIITSVFERTGKLRLKHDDARKILFSLSPDSEKLKDTDPGYGFKKEEILQMISPVWERLARQVDLTLKTSSIGSQKVEKIYIVSSLNVDDSMMDYMSDQLGTKTEFFDPFKVKKTGSSVESLSLPEKVLLSPALGFALSDNSYTPNVIFTYVEKNKEAVASKINKAIFFSFLAVLAVCVVTLIYQRSHLNNLKVEQQKLEKELALYTPLLTKETVQGAVDKLKMQKTMVQQYVQRYLGLAAMEEVSDLTPQNIRLLNFRTAQGNDTSKNDPKAPKEAGNSIFIEGIIFDKKDNLEPELSKYVLKLGGTQIFSGVTVQKKDITTFKKNDVLHFTLNARTGKS
jgi:hypothetical protein